jgi:hypothetical protein
VLVLVPQLRASTSALPSVVSILPHPSTSYVWSSRSLHYQKMTVARHAASMIAAEVAVIGAATDVMTTIVVVLHATMIASAARTIVVTTMDVATAMEVAAMTATAAAATTVVVVEEAITDVMTVTVVTVMAGVMAGVMLAAPVVEAMTASFALNPTVETTLMTDTVEDEMLAQLTTSGAERSAK